MPMLLLRPYEFRRIRSDAVTSSVPLRTGTGPLLHPLSFPDAALCAALELVLARVRMPPVGLSLPPASLASAAATGRTLRALEPDFSALSAGRLSGGRPVTPHVKR